MKTCEKYRQQFVDALYNELIHDSKRDFDEHLAGCPECSSEFEQLRSALSTMDKRVRTEPNEADWKRFWNELQPNLTPAERKSSLLKIISWKPIHLPAWGYAIAAVLILVFGIYVGRNYFTSNQTITRAGSTTASVVQADATDSTTAEALAYLERSRNLLIGLNNLDPEHHAMVDIGHSQQISRTLIDQGNVLTASLNKPDQQLLRELIRDLGVILLQLSNVEVRPGVPALEFVQKGIDKKSILLKINVEEMKAASRKAVKARSENKTTQHL